MSTTETVQIPKLQRAWRTVRSGVPSTALEFQTSVPVPSKLQPGEVLVKVQAAALNPVGYKVMKLAPNWIAKRPHTVEHDLAGIVADENGTDFVRGDEVFGWIPVALTRKTGQGSLAEYARVTGDHLVKRPANVSPTEAAGITLAGMTAYMALVDIGKIEPGQTVFVNGGSSSVGGFAIQIAKAKGCKVVAACSGKNIDFVKGLGADEVMDYTTSPLHQQLTANPPTPKFHVLFDCAGLPSPDLYTHSNAYLAPNGVFISVGPTPNSSKQILDSVRTVFEAFLRPSWLGGVKGQWKLVSVSNKRPYLEDLQRLVAEGKVKPLVDSTYPFEDALKAYDRIMTGRAKGKVIVDIS